MGTINNYQIREIQKGNEIILKIVIKSKLFLWTIFASTTIIAILSYCLIPIIINDIIDLGNLFLLLFLLILFLLYIKGCFWMLFGKEEIILRGTEFFYFKRIFNFSILRRKYDYMETSNWNTNALYYYANRSQLKNIYSMFYGSTSYGVAFGLSNGKVIFKYKNKICKFANNIKENEANDIIRVIFEHFGDVVNKDI